MMQHRSKYALYT